MKGEEEEEGGGRGCGDEDVEFAEEGEGEFVGLAAPGVMCGGWGVVLW